MAFEIDKGGVVISDIPEQPTDIPRGYRTKQPKHRFELDYPAVPEEEQVGPFKQGERNFGLR